MSIIWDENYCFKLISLFGDTPRVRIIEFFLAISEKKSAPQSYISQISRLLDLSKSSVKKAIDELVGIGFLTEKQVKTHAKYPQRDIKLNLSSSLVFELQNLYRHFED